MTPEQWANQTLRIARAVGIADDETIVGWNLDVDGEQADLSVLLPNGDRVNVTITVEEAVAIMNGEAP